MLPMSCGVECVGAHGCAPCFGREAVEKGRTAVRPYVFAASSNL